MDIINPTKNIYNKNFRNFKKAYPFLKENKRNIIIKIFIYGLNPFLRELDIFN